MIGQPNADRTMRFTCKVLTVDPSQRKVQVLFKGDARTLEVYSTPPAFRWPVVGENWVVEQKNGAWYLCEISQNSVPAALSDFDPGDAVINAFTGKVRVVGSENGATDFTLTSTSAQVDGPADVGTLRTLGLGSHQAAPGIALTSLTDANFAAANKDGTAATPSLRTLGLGTNQAAPGATSLQVAGSTKNAFWAGAVGPSGAVRLNGTFGWSVARTATGTYTLQLQSGPTGIWAILIVQCNESVGAIAEVDYVSQSGGTTTFTVKTISGPFGFGLADINWSFQATATNN